MSNTTKRIQGAAQQVGGAIKKTVGKAIGSEQMETEGRVTELSGVAKQAAAKGAERAKGAAEELGGAIKNGAGKLLDDQQMEAEGEATRLKGAARGKLNQ
jgi:uncharacterized protein YjbJ (UPF0337 family)